MLVTPFCIMLTCLQVHPDRSQFFRYDSVSLSCEDQLNSTGWKVKRKTPDGGVRACSSGWGDISSGSTCIIRNTYPTDTGVYWCESETEERSNAVNITITDRPVILESPALPVSEGASVTLRCKAETNPSDHMYDFHKDGHSTRSNCSGEMTIHSASESDEGLYTCSISGGGESAGSWLTVTASLSPSSSAPPAASTTFSTSRLLCHLLVGTPYLLSTILLGVIYRDKRRAAQMVADRKGRADVAMEIVV
ncbi:Fc receptor-like protein 5 [Leuresthes tenuis]|uniref:Fc receptor-like protein 5 n=1 Tax=Leuresthes tenuis TaxID=355514 RepID=UPI003B506855